MAVTVRLQGTNRNSAAKVTQIRDYNFTGQGYYQRPNPIIRTFYENPNYFVLPRLPPQAQDSTLPDLAFLKTSPDWCPKCKCADCPPGDTKCLAIAAKCEWSCAHHDPCAPVSGGDGQYAGLRGSHDVH